MRGGDDYRLKYALQKGDIIVCGEDSYVIGEILGLGGTSILYSANKNSLQDGAKKESKLQFAIKEWFPYSDNYEKFIRKDGIVQPKELESPDCFDHYRELFQTELKKGEEIRNATNKAIIFWDILQPEAIYHGGRWETETVCHGIFAIMERQDQKGLTFKQLLDEIALPPSKENPLRTGGLPTVHTTACIMEAVLKTIQILHERACYLHLDISDNNLFFTDYNLPNGDIGDAHLLDFAYAKKLGANKKTDLIEEKDLFSTHGFVPPEFRHKNDGTLQLGPEADLFSVGALMLRALLPDERIDFLGKSPRIREITIYPHDGKQLGINEKIRGDLNRILFNAMNPDSEKRYPNVLAMLVEIQKLKTDTAPPQYRLPENLSSPDYFLEGSRNEEIEIFEQALRSRNSVFLHGAGGIGKSETARLLAKRLNPPRGAYFIHYENSMRQTIMHLDFSRYEFTAPEGVSAAEAEEMEKRERLQILRDYYQDTVLIFDNFNVEGHSLGDLVEETTYQDLMSLSGITFIFTTRYEIPDHPEWEITAMREEAALQLMEHYCPKVSEILLKKIIEEVNGHTLTLALIGKSIKESHGKLSAVDVLRALQGHSLSKMNSPVISSDKDRKYRQAQIYAHLKVLFNLSSLSEMQKSAMLFAAFCSGEGMPIDWLATALWKQTHPEPFNSFEDTHHHFQKCGDVYCLLAKSGWLTVSTENVITIHPVIQEIVLEELKPTEDNCGQGLRYLQKKHMCWGNYKVRSNSSQFARYFSKAGKILHADWCLNLEQTIRTALDKQEAILLPYIKAVEVEKRKTDAKADKLACCYEQLAHVYISLDGRGKESVDCCLTALRLREDDPTTTKDQRAWTLFYTGLAYQRLHSDTKRGMNITDSLVLAEEFHTLALSLWNNCPPSAVGTFNASGNMGEGPFVTAYQQMLLDYGYEYDRLPRDTKDCDMNKIVQWLHIEAEMEDVSAMLSLAVCYRDGLGCTKDLEKSYYWATMAVALQSKHDLLQLPNTTWTESDQDGYIIHGVYAQPDINGARVFLASQIINGSYYDITPEEKIYWLRYGAEAGDARYMIHYASCLLEGTGCKVDSDEAFDWLCKVARMTSKDDDRVLSYRGEGEWIQPGFDREKEIDQLLTTAEQVVIRYYDEAHVAEWYRYTGAIGEQAYMVRIGERILENAQSKADYSKAFDWFKELCAKGSCAAKYYLGWMYLNGYAEGDVQDIDEALSIFLEIYDYSDKACLILAEIYFGLNETTEDVVPAEPSLALLCCQIAADLRRDENRNYVDYVTADILQLIDAWVARTPSEEWDSGIYLSLSDFCYQHAFDTHHAIADEYKAIGEALKKIEPEEPNIHADEEANEEIEAIVNAVIKELEEEQRARWAADVLPG